MSFRVRVVDTSKPHRSSVLVVPVGAGLNVRLASSDGLTALIKQPARKQEFSGEWGSACIFQHPDSTRAGFLALVGLGDQQHASRTREAFRRGLGRVITEASVHGFEQVIVDLRGFGSADTAFIAEAVYEASRLSVYTFTETSKKLAKRARAREIKELVLCVPKKEIRGTRSIIAKAKSVMDGVDLARTLVDRPANTMSPKALMQTARHIAQGSAAISVQVFNRQQAKRKGFTAFLEVAKGSQAEPYVIHLKYKPAKRRAKKKIILIGKGITFDSGGLSLKPSQYMETMKIDMAGAAAVLGVFSALRELNLGVEVHGIIAACENMPSGSAYRPGDVIVAKNGKTIEVANTDAEGRITLADALVYAQEQKPDSIIDLATLTGASMVGLGESIAALFGNDEVLLDEITEAADLSSERLALLPMPEEYAQLLESHVADLRNIPSSNYGGAITAAMFLEEFVGTVPWAHLDIAGPAYVERQAVSYLRKGASGFGVRMLVNYLVKSSA